MYLTVRILRVVSKIAFYGIAVFLVVGFVAQLLPPRKYPWVLEISPYTWPITQNVSYYLPTVFQGYDVALLIALALALGCYVVVDRALWAVQDVLRVRAVNARLRVPRVEPAKGAAGPAAPIPPTPLPSRPTASSRSPVYSSEAVVVVDLVNSTSIVTRFGNTFLLMLKHRLEHQVNDVCLRNTAGFTKGTGDGFLVFFPTLASAVAAVREIFEALPTMNTDLPEGGEIALRGALNFGEVIVDRDGDRTGSAVHKTFRLQSLPAASLIESEGGIKQADFPQKNYILVSEEAMPGVTQIAGLHSRFLGLCELRGFPGLHRVFQI